MPWIPAAVHHRQDNDFVPDRAEVHGVWKSADDCAPYVPLHAGIGQRILENGRNCRFDGRGEDGPEAHTLVLIPRSRIK
jgi:hypothetical protein